MAKKFTKVMSLLLAMVMVFSMLGVTAMAYDGPNQVGDYLAYDSKGTSGDYTQESLKVIENDMVTLSKTIAQTGENAFDITLEVTTQQNLKDMVLDPNAALCLVFDISNSMLKCGVCGAGNIVNNKVSGTHAAGCTYTGALDATLGSEQTRMTAAVAAAKDLVDTFGATSGKGQRMMSVIFFWTDAKCVQTWVDASKAENRDALKAAIDGATDQVGTNHDAALMLAKNLLDNDEVADINNKYVVLLTDGVPTGFNKAGTESTADDYITGYYNWNERFVAEDHAVESADNLLATGAEVHAICYGTDSLKTHGKNIPVNEWMAANVTSAPEFCYPASNPDALKFNFESIVQQIEERVDLWTVVDPMGDYILYNGEPVGDAFTFADNTLTWDLRVDTPAVDEGKYTYTLTYPITLDTAAEGFEFDKLYPANKATSLKYALVENDEVLETKYNYFNVPTVFAPYIPEVPETPTITFNNGDASNISFMLIDADDNVEFLYKVDIEDQTFFEIPVEAGKISAVFVKQSTSGMFWTAEEVDQGTMQNVIDCLAANNPSYKGYNALCSGEGEHDLEFKPGKFVTYTFENAGEHVVYDNDANEENADAITQDPVVDSDSVADVPVTFPYTVVGIEDVVTAEIDGIYVIYIPENGKIPAIVWTSEDADIDAIKAELGVDGYVEELTGLGSQDVTYKQNKNKNKTVTFTFEAVEAE